MTYKRARWRSCLILIILLLLSACGEEGEAPETSKELAFSDAQKELLYLVTTLPGSGSMVMIVGFEAAIAEAYVATDILLEVDDAGAFHLVSTKRCSEEEAIGGKDGREGVKTEDGFFTRRQGGVFVKRSAIETDWKRWWEETIASPGVVLSVLLPHAHVAKEQQAGETIFSIERGGDAASLDEAQAALMEKNETTWPSWLGHQITWSSLEGSVTHDPEGEETMLKGSIKGVGIVKKGLSAFQVALKLKLEVRHAPADLSISTPEEWEPVGRPAIRAMIDDVLGGLGQ